MARIGPMTCHHERASSRSHMADETRSTMDQKSFSTRHRGVHVPDHLRKLELVTSGSSPRSRGGSFRPLVPPHSRRDLFPAKQRSNATSDDHLASFFGNLTVWIDKKLHSVSAHAGYDKIYLYLALLRCFIDEVTPHEEIQRLVSDMEAYVAYLSSPGQGVSTTSPTRSQREILPTIHAAISPRLVATKGVLSPRAIQAIAKEAAQEASLSSPRITKRRPKKIIELSDHEESILEVALFYDEVVDQLSSAAKKGKKQRGISLTQQWLQFASEKHKQVLTKMKTKVTRQTLFCAGSGISATPTSRVGSGGLGLTSSVPRAHTTEFSAYFSLLVLCLQETTRRISVFSCEIASFIWSVLCQETLQSIELMFDDVLSLHSSSHEALQKLRASRQEVQDTIAHCESEITRLQGQNMRSLAVWELEKQEMTLLEQEEVWHGHCKALLLKSLLDLADEVNLVTWLQVRAPRPTLHSHATDNVDTNAELQAVNYLRLPEGAALLHFRLRSRVVYMAHLIILCRSFLHLQEKRSLREVMESTSTNPKCSSPPPSPSQQSQQLAMLDMYDWQQTIPVTPMHSNGSAPMERISAGELLTLKDINHALRSIEELYISIGASGDHSQSPTLPTASLGCDASTQFPTTNDEPTTATTSPFLKSLAYSTMAFTGPSPPPFVRAGSNRGQRRNAEIVVMRIPMGSGRRLGSTSTVVDEAIIPSQPPIRLAKVWTKLPKHCREVLILPLLEPEPFPPDSPTSIVEALTKEEILSRIQWLYAGVIEASFSASSSNWSSPETRKTSAIPLSRHLWKSWNSEQFIDFIHAAFIEKYDTDVASGEREFVRFLASIQLLYSGLGAALNPTTGGAGPSQSNDKIYFFARMTTLFNMEARDKVMKNRLPAQLFPIFFYCMHVLQQVAVTKKHIDEGGLVIDVWTVAGPPVASQPSTPRSGSGGGGQRGRRVRATTRSYTFSNHAHHTSKFVLLESVKTLLLYLLEGTSPNASEVVAERVVFLSERAIMAKVALLSSVIPGAYEMSSSPTNVTAAASMGINPPVPNGELTDTFILPLDFAIQAIVNAWLQQHKSLLHRLSIAMRAADVEASGEITFEEFTHVMMVGSASSAPNAISPGQLTQVYAALLSETPHRRSVRWPELIVAVADEIDLLGMGDRLSNVDFRSIQRALLHTMRGNASSAWVANPSYRAGDVAALCKVWTLNHQAMRDNFALTFQAENALEGVCLWQSGNARVDRVEKLLRDSRQSTKTPRGRLRRSSIVGAIGDLTSPSRYEATEIDMAPDELDIAWRALYYLQLDHTQAHHIADHVRTKQQQRHPKMASSQ